MSADKYQQSAIRAAKSNDAVLRGEWISKRSFTPANDPFSTAAVASELIKNIDKQTQPENIYLSPPSTKIQAIDFTPYWQLEFSFWPKRCG